MSREDLGVHSLVIPAAATEGILETLIRDGVMQHVEMASQGRRGSRICHVCQMCFKFPQYISQQRAESEVMGIIYPDGRDSSGAAPNTERLFCRISKAQHRESATANALKIICGTRSKVSAKQHSPRLLEGQEQGSTPKFKHPTHFYSTFI